MTDQRKRRVSRKKNIFFEVLRGSIPTDTTLFKPPIFGGFCPATVSPPGRAPAPAPAPELAQRNRFSLFHVDGEDKFPARLAAVITRRPIGEGPRHENALRIEDVVGV